MVVAVWSVKGGVGVTSVAALLAIGQAERAEDTLLIDLCGDMPLVLGCEQVPVEPGIAEWLAMAHPTSEALDRIALLARTDLRFVPRGLAPIGDLRAVKSLSDQVGGVIVDCGVVHDAMGHRGTFVASAEYSVLVARECYLTLRAVQESAVVPTGVVVIKEPHRRLGRPDVEAAARAPVIAEIAVDRAITDALDAGLVSAHLPRRLVRSMSRAINRAA